MPKAVIRINYQDYVMEFEDALRVANLLTTAEQFTTRGYGDETAYYVYPNDRREVDVKIISDAVYNTGKLAGAPPPR